MITIPVPETLAFLPLTACLFLFFLSSVSESKRSKNAVVTRAADACSEEVTGNESKVDFGLFHGLEDIEREESAEKHLQKTTPHSHNPILVLRNIES